VSFSLGRLELHCEQSEHLRILPQNHAAETTAIIDYNKRNLTFLFCRSWMPSLHIGQLSHLPLITFPGTYSFFSRWALGANAMRVSYKLWPLFIPHRHSHAILAAPPSHSRDRLAYLNTLPRVQWRECTRTPSLIKSPHLKADMHLASMPEDSSELKILSYDLRCHHNQQTIQPLRASEDVLFGNRHANRQGSRNPFSQPVHS